MCAVAVLALTGCGVTPAQRVAGVFALDPATGHPVICYEQRTVYLDWEGRAYLVTPGGLPPGVVSWPSIQLYPSAADQRELLRGCSVPTAGAVVAVALGVQTPQGWPRCLAVTVERPATAGRRDVDREFGAYLFDAGSSRLLAELNLTEMYFALYQRPSPDVLTSAVVSSAFLGPDGAIGLVVRFGWPGGYLEEAGTWDGSTWVPFIGLSYPAQLGEHVVYVGPANNVVDFTGAGQGGYRGRVEFYDTRGNLNAAYALGVEGPERLLRAVALRLTSFALLTGVSSFAGTSLLALLWWLMPALWPRRRLESRRGDTQ